MSSDRTAAVSVSGLGKSFGTGAPVLRDVDLDVSIGECVVLLGPSGCGKTTLLRCIAGLEEPSTGVVTFEGVDRTADQPQQRPVGLVFQDFALYPHKRVRDNIGLGLKVARLPKPEIARRVDEIAHLLQLDHLLDRYPRELSGGQKQRVGIGRALAKQPRVLLMDEPLSNLDAKLRHEMRSEIEALRSRLTDTAIIYVTHDQSEAMSLADRVVVMNAGQIEQQGTGHEIYQEPRSRFVAEFVGTPPINILEMNNGLTLALRPEAIRPGPLADAASLGEATLRNTEHMGHEILARYSTSLGEVTVRLPADSPDTPESAVLSYKRDSALWFDEQGHRVPVPLMEDELAS